MKKLLALAFISGLSLLFISWGGSGHYVINQKSTLSFPTSMNFLLFWADSLANHGSDADDRKSWDTDESIRHYIDIDNYSEFVATGHIPSTYDSVVSIHGLQFVEGEGILPWATMNTYDSLKIAFQQHDWQKAMLHASDLGHYVGDGHMPLHITRNYNGQMTGQSRIHSRYESSMVGNNITALSNYIGDSVHLVTNVNQYVLNYIYNNNKYVDSVLLADMYAQNLAGNYTSSTYKQALFSKSKDFTILLFHNASHALAELIYSAWTEAGCPQTNTGTCSELKAQKSKITISPNPVSSNAVFKFSSPVSSNAILKILDINGKQVIEETINMQVGETVFKPNLSKLCNGIYFATLSGLGKTEILRFEVNK